MASSALTILLAADGMDVLTATFRDLNGELVRAADAYREWKRAQRRARLRPSRGWRKHVRTLKARGRRLSKGPSR